MITHPMERIPLNTFAIAFGLAGLAEVWTAGADVLGLPSAIGWALWIVAAIAWLWLLCADELAVGSFAVGVLFWVMIQTILFARLTLRPPLPGPLTPTLAIMAAPPAVGGLAWFAIRGGRIDTVQVGFAGVLVLMLLVQLFFLPCYHQLPFSLGFWSFTFPFAAVGTYGVEWARHKPGLIGSIGAVAILIAITTLVAAIAIRSVVAWQRDRARGRQDLEEEIVALADNEAVR